MSAANNIEQNKQKINDLNVFPVPDGDTGTNMSLTMSSAAAELRRMQDRGADEVAEHAAAALLRGARGNSGVILSLLFRGLSKGLKGVREIGGPEFVLAFRSGVDAAYKAVMKPTEGTILTVARLAAEKGEALLESGVIGIDELFLAMLEAAEDTLAKTPEMLPVLKQAGVVDAGGKGLITILNGMRSVLLDGEIVEAVQIAETSEKADFASFNTEDITFTYCTEFLINRKAGDNDPAPLRSFLQEMGDSMVFVADESVLKVHIHTNHPGLVLEEGLKYGSLASTKIENMRDQHTAQWLPQPEMPQRRVVPAEKKYGFVVVSAGPGLDSVFHDLGADKMVSGGQTMNPSTEDILAAIDAVPAENIFVLPNNKNIIMTAEMASRMSERNVIVLPTTTIPQGVVCMLNFDGDAEPEVNRTVMREAMTTVRTGQVTYAVRDSVVDRRKIKQGEILGLLENKVHTVDKSLDKVMQKLCASMIGKESSFVTLYYGSDVSPEDAKTVVEQLEQKFGDSVEITLVSGGQPVYYYIISVE